MNRLGQGTPEETAQDEPADESGKGLFGRVAVPAGFAIGVLGVLLSFGLVILPARTAGEKSVIFLASLALAIAGTAGIGAWRSARRFAVTAASACLAIILLAMLSITAASPVPRPALAAPPPHRTGQTAGSTPAIPSEAPTTPSPSPSSPSPAATPTGGKPLYLADLTGTGAAWESGSWQLAGTTYAHSLGDPDPCSAPDYPDSATYQLHGSYRKFAATVGVADDADSIDHYTPLAFEVDGTPGTDGSANVLGTKSAQWHQPATIEVPLPAGTTSVTLTISQPGNCENSAGIWGNARVIP